MAISYKIEKRRVVPNWRDFKRTVNLNELIISGNDFPKLEFDVSKVAADWNSNKSIGTAADLINGAFISEKFDFKELQEATTFIMQHSEKASNLLLDVAGKINGGIAEDIVTTNISQLEVDSIDEFQAHFESQLAYKILRRTKNRAKSELYNPIIWVELARLYAFFGVKEKAEKAMVVALQLAPDNRYVLRSATRMFIHFEQHEKALFYLRRSPSTKVDPWLISAHIATSSILSRYSPYVKNGIQIIKGGNHTDYDTTELNSSLGTLEYQEGSIKNAKRHQQLAMKAPNDNSLAQLEWLSHQDKAFEFDTNSFKNVPNHFEAFAFNAYDSGKWKDVVDNSINWFLDLPYSKRPILLGSYVASMYLKDYEKAIILCKMGLKANPHDTIILNNIVYSLMSMNKLDEAQPYLDSLTRINLSNLDPDELVPLQATLGLCAFRSGNVQEGEWFYELAIATAQSSNQKEMAEMATLIFFRELINARSHEMIEKYLQRIGSINPGKHLDIKQLKDEAIKLYSEYKANQKTDTKN
jgi:tetratricopeptide (TPR) repeat protein